MTGIRTIILDYLKRNGISKSHLASKLGETPQLFSKKFSKEDLTTDYIRRICDALEHNFFADLAKEYQPTAEEWLEQMVGEREPAYIVSKDAELNKWKKILERLPDDLDYIKKQLDKLNNKN